MTNAKELRLGLLFISPFILGFILLTVYPICASFYYSFCDYDVISPPRFNGGAHYAELFKDELYLKSIWNTAVFTVFAVPVMMLTALVLAFLLNLKLRGQSLYRTIFFLPSIVPLVASSVLWLWILNPDYGLLNMLLSPVLSVINSLLNTSLETPSWLTDPSFTKPALILMSAWGVGGTMILYLAGLGDIPAQLYEAADLDGAGAWNKTWHVTLPMLSPVLFFTLIMGLISCFQYFAQAWVITPGGQPGDSTLFYALYLFYNAFLYLRMGYASAQAWILFLVIILVTVLVFRGTRKFIYYGYES